MKIFNSRFMSACVLTATGLTSIGLTSCGDDNDGPSGNEIPSASNVYLQLRVERIESIDGTYVNAFANAFQQSEQGMRGKISDGDISANGKKLRFHASDPNIAGTFDYSAQIQPDADNMVDFIISTPLNKSYEAKVYLNAIPKYDVPEFSEIRNGQSYYYKEGVGSTNINILAQLNSGNKSYTAKDNRDGTFTFSGVPSGDYYLYYIVEQTNFLPVAKGISGATLTGVNVTQGLKPVKVI